MKNKGPTFLSVIIPVYNESKRVYKLTKILKYLGRNTFRTEIIVVNDGSKDNTLLKLKNLTSKKLQKNLNVKIISYRKNKGKGYAIKKGVLKARGKHRLFLDIDLSTPISEFQKFLTHLGKYDILIGSRKIKGAKVSQRQSLIREALGKNFTFLKNQIGKYENFGGKENFRRGVAGVLEKKERGREKQGRNDAGASGMKFFGNKKD